MQQNFKNFSDKKFVIYGLGISGLSTAKYLTSQGLEVIATDDNSAAIAHAKSNPKLTEIKFKNLEEIALDKNFTIIFAPGIPLYFPKKHKILEIVAKTKAELICDIELFYQLNQGNNKFIAITGTNGKSTTTALAGFVFQKLGIKNAIGGNIGLPCFEMPQNQQNFSYILETSSFQLDLIAQARFNIAALLNITADHLDRHGSIENYIAAKKRIFLNQALGDYSLIDIDNKNSRQVFEGLKANSAYKAKLVAISTTEIQKNGIALIDGKIYVNLWNHEMRFDLRSQYLPGKHNDQNMAFSFAIALCHLRQQSEMMIDKIHATQLIEAIQQFKGLAHRIQILGNVDGINFINDSKATNADSSANALKIFENIFWILGGKAKEGGISSLAPFFSKIHKAYLIGESSAEFAKILAKNSVNFELCDNLKNAFSCAYRDAKTSDSLNKNLLLSPACASLDQWKNFEERGNAFCKMFDELKT